MRDLRDKPVPLRFTTEQQVTGQVPYVDRKEEEQQPIYHIDSYPLSPAPSSFPTGVENLFWFIIFISIALGIYLNFRTF